jgi:hypothetical protein
MSEAVVEAGEANTIVNDFSRDKQLQGQAGVWCPVGQGNDVDIPA